MEKKQTAVEWLYVKLSTSSSDELVGNINNWFDQAKQMEKEQTISAVKYGCSDWGSAKDAEQYYNETYGQTKN
jgi:hypothetical protein